MKQEAILSAVASRAESKSTTPSRIRAYKPKEKDPSNANGLTKGRANSVPRDVNNHGISKIRRSQVVNRPKSGENGASTVVGSQKDSILEEVRHVGWPKSRPVVEQFAKPTRRRLVPDSGSLKKNGGDNKELQEKLDQNEVLIKNLQGEVLGLKAELEKANSLNVELQSQNKKLSEDLAAAEAKIAAFTNHHQQAQSNMECPSPNTKANQRVMAPELGHEKDKEEIVDRTVETSQMNAAVNSGSSNVFAQQKIPQLHAPPPPPPPPRPLGGATLSRKPSTVVELYHSLSSSARKQNSLLQGNSSKSSISSAHSSIVGEIQNRSAHLLAIKSDIETKGDFINGLISKIQAAAFTDIEDVLAFVDWLDNELLSLADEHAVLKHFEWPEKKADAMREAATEYRGLKLLEFEVSSFKDEYNIPYGVALKKMASLLDKSEKSIQRLTKLRNSVRRSYQEYKIPTDWMLDSGIVIKIQQASRKLAKKYVERVVMEVESTRYSERESTQEALLLQGVHFAYRVHQIAGGLDPETLCAFEEMRRLVPQNLRGSQPLLVAGIPSA